MLLFTDSSAINNPSPTGAAVVIRKNGTTNVPIKLTKAIKSSGTTYEEELERINISAE